MCRIICPQGVKGCEICHRNALERTGDARGSAVICGGFWGFCSVCDGNGGKRRPVRLEFELGHCFLLPSSLSLLTAVKLKCVTSPPPHFVQVGTLSLCWRKMLAEGFFFPPPSPSAFWFFFYLFFFWLLSSFFPLSLCKTNKQADMKDAAVSLPVGR